MDTRFRCPRFVDCVSTAFARPASMVCDTGRDNGRRAVVTRRSHRATTRAPYPTRLPPSVLLLKHHFPRPNETRKKITGRVRPCRTNESRLMRRDTPRRVVLVSTRTLGRHTRSDTHTRRHGVTVGNDRTREKRNLKLRIFAAASRIFLQMLSTSRPLALFVFLSPARP